MDKQHKCRSVLQIICILLCGLKNNSYLAARLRNEYYLRGFPHILTSVLMGCGRCISCCGNSLSLLINTMIWINTNN